MYCLKCSNLYKAELNSEIVNFIYSYETYARWYKYFFRILKKASGTF
jgi:hypothetical protein